MKKLFTLILVALCSISVWSYDFEVDGIFYTKLKKNNVEVSGTNISGNFVIPDTVVYKKKTYQVTSIGDYAFKNYSSLTSVVIPNGVTSIGDWAFYNCYRLTSVTISESVTSIGDYAFSSCYRLTSVTIPESVTSIGDEAFYDCDALTSIAIPKGVTSIGDYAFYECKNLKSIAIPKGVTSIGDKAFYECYNLNFVTIPEGVTSIGDYAFYDCDGLTSITIPNSVTSIGNEAFLYCSWLRSIIINSSSIEEYCHSNINKLLYDEYIRMPRRILINNEEVTNLVIPDSILSINDYAFYNCTNLTSVTIPNSVTSIGYKAFEDCNGLTSLTIPEGVTSIGKYTFYNCDNLKSITIPSTLTSIGEGAFDYVKSIAINSRSIEEYCHSNINKLLYDEYIRMPRRILINNEEVTNLVIPDSILSINDYAFYNCTNLTSVTIPNSITSIGYKAFYECKNLKSIAINSSSIEECCQSNMNKLLYDINICMPRRILISNEEVTNVVIPDSILSINDYAFYNCTNLTSITIPNSVTIVGYDAFKDCKNLKSIAINSSSIEECCQSNINKLLYDKYIQMPRRILINNEEVTDIVIPDSVQSIPDYAFYNCTNLTSITIPNSVTSIGKYTFYNCDNLKSITIPSTLTSIGEGAFDYVKSIAINSRSIEEYCTSTINQLLYDNGITSPRKILINHHEVKDIVIPSRIDSLYDRAFYGCSSIRSIICSKSLTTIGKQAFEACKSLSYVHLPHTLTSIEEDAFKDCIFAQSNFVNQTYWEASSTNYWGARIVDKEEGGVVVDKNAVVYCREWVNSANIPDKVTCIKSNAFIDVEALKSISFPMTLTSIEEGTFDKCTKIQDVIWNCKNYTNFSADNHPFQASSDSIKTFTFGNSVEHIPAYLCYGMTNLENISLPLTLKSIGKRAFEHCHSLTSVSIPESVTRVGQAAFKSCSSLQEVVWNVRNHSDYSSLLNSPFYDSGEQLTSFILGDSVEYIPAYLCSGLKKLESITIPEAVTSVGEQAFFECVSLQRTSYAGDITKWCNMHFASLTSNPMCFSKNLYINHAPVKIVVIPETMVDIPDYIFYNCRSLNRLIIHSRVRSIGGSAFEGCTSLHTIYCVPTTPPNYKAGSFWSPPSENTVLLVPTESMETYKNTYPWRNFFNNIMPLN